MYCKAAPIILGTWRARRADQAEEKLQPLRPACRRRELAAMAEVPSACRRIFPEFADSSPRPAEFPPAVIILRQEARSPSSASSGLWRARLKTCNCFWKSRLVTTQATPLPCLTQSSVQSSNRQRSCASASMKMTDTVLQLQRHVP